MSSRLGPYLLWALTLFLSCEAQSLPSPCDLFLGTRLTADLNRNIYEQTRQSFEAGTLRDLKLSRSYSTGKSTWPIETLLAYVDQNAPSHLRVMGRLEKLPGVQIVWDFSDGAIIKRRTFLNIGRIRLNQILMPAKQPANDLEALKVAFDLAKIIEEMHMEQWFWLPFLERWRTRPLQSQDLPSRIGRWLGQSPAGLTNQLLTELATTDEVLYTLTRRLQDLNPAFVPEFEQKDTKGFFDWMFLPFGANPGFRHRANLAAYERQIFDHSTLEEVLKKRFRAKIHISWFTQHIWRLLAVSCLAITLYQVAPFLLHPNDLVAISESFPEKLREKLADRDGNQKLFLKNLERYRQLHGSDNND